MGALFLENKKYKLKYPNQKYLNDEKKRVDNTNQHCFGREGKHNYNFSPHYDDHSQKLYGEESNKYFSSLPCYGKKSNNYNQHHYYGREGNYNSNQHHYDQSQNQKK